VSFAALTLCVASQRVFIVTGVYFVIDSVRKLLDTRIFPYWMEIHDMFWKPVLSFEEHVETSYFILAVFLRNI